MSVLVFFLKKFARLKWLYSILLKPDWKICKTCLEQIYFLHSIVLDWIICPLLIFHFALLTWYVCLLENGLGMFWLLFRCNTLTGVLFSAGEISKTWSKHKSNTFCPISAGCRHESRWTPCKFSVRNESDSVSFSVLLMSQLQLRCLIAVVKWMNNWCWVLENYIFFNV